MAADDRLNTRFGTFGREFERAEKIARICERHGRHGVGDAKRDELRNFDSALGHGVGRVNAQVYKRSERR